MIVAHRVRQLRSWLTVLGVGLIVAGLHAVAAADDETSATAVTVQPATSSESFTRRPYGWHRCWRKPSEATYPCGCAGYRRDAGCRRPFHAGL